MAGWFRKTLPLRVPTHNSAGIVTVRLVYIIKCILATIHQRSTSIICPPSPPIGVRSIVSLFSNGRELASALVMAAQLWIGVARLDGKVLAPPSPSLPHEVIKLTRTINSGLLVHCEVQCRVGITSLPGRPVRTRQSRERIPLC